LRPLFVTWAAIVSVVGTDAGAPFLVQPRSRMPVSFSDLSRAEIPFNSFNLSQTAVLDQGAETEVRTGAVSIPH
jgi:hypothetical protein